MPLEITIEHLVSHIHTQNDLAKSFIKRLQLMSRPLLIRAKTFCSTSGHAILHVVALVYI